MDGKRQGPGMLTDLLGNVYEGDFVDDEKEGIGIYKLANGNKYEGEFKAGKSHGHGLFFFLLEKKQITKTEMCNNR